jgi:hypothetical protein
MIDERFSRQSFDSEGWNTEASRTLCGQLDAEIHLALMALLVPAAREIVDKLNSMGHSLVDASVPFGDDIHYREALDPQRKGGFKMILAADLVITVGYPETRNMSIQIDQAGI